MANYLIKRILLFAFTIFLFTIIGFGLTTMIPGDSAVAFSNISLQEVAGETETKNYQEFIRKQMGSNLPAFYISLGSLSDLKEPMKIADKNMRYVMEKLAWECGESERVENYYYSTIRLDSLLASKTDSSGKINRIRISLITLQKSAKLSEIKHHFKALDSLIKDIKNGDIQIQYTHSKTTFQTIYLTKNHWRSYIPVIRLHTHNRYHRWIFGTESDNTIMPPFSSRGIIRGDFGYSYVTGEPIGAILYSRIGWSIALSITAILLSFAIGILIANLSILFNGALFIKYTDTFLFILYSIPSFVFATILLYLFANPDLLNWFPASGIAPMGGYPEGSSTFKKILTSIHYLILPLITYMYGTIAYIYRLLRIELLEEMTKDHIKTARAKGISEIVVVFKHAFKNASFSMITLFANIFPYTIAGSVIIEIIFTLPGMGYEIYQSILTHDYPFIIAFFTISGIITLLGFWLSDLLYVLVNPKLRGNTTRKNA